MSNSTKHASELAIEEDETLFPMDTGVAPPFHQIDPTKFQFVCRDVLERQRDAGVVSCGIYGTGGQAQYGIDLIAPLAESEKNARSKRSVNFISPPPKHSQPPSP